MSKVASKTGRIEGVVLDVYGTLVEIGDKRHTYKQMLTLLASRGRTPLRSDARTVMTIDGGLHAALQALQATIEPGEIEQLQRSLQLELDSVRLAESARGTLARLRDAGVPVVLCSNLASPYASPPREMLSDLLPLGDQSFVWSFEVKAVKPERAMYAAACAALNLPPGRVLMVGDSLDADVLGPRRFGLQALHLDRLAPNDSVDPGALRSLASLPQWLGLRPV